MDEEWLGETIAYMRQIGNDTQQCEVKKAKGGLPASTLETLSAFSNGSGGYLILGVSEEEGFTPVDGFDARSTQDALSSACEKLTPVVRPEIAVLQFEGASVVCAKIPEMRPRDKPCYITSRRQYEGTYIRTGDGDRRMSAYEIDRLLEEHRQPRYDDEIVQEATLDDLDSDLLEGFVKRQRELHPRILGTKSTEEILLDLHIARRDGEALRPTLAGLMSLGSFPQKFFPRLNVTFTAFPGITKTERLSDSRRFIDARSIIGPIPVMIVDTLAALERNMRTGAVIEGAFRHDVPDYPLAAAREAIANALMHRDYSPEAHGSQVQVNLYADRLEILNPGGLYGDVTIETLGESGISSTRNQFLSNILETTPYPDGGYVVENRGTGYQEIEEQLRQARMPPAHPQNSTVSFTLTMERRHDVSIGAAPAAGAQTAAQDIDSEILRHLEERGDSSARELAEALGIPRSTLSAHLKKLVEASRVEPLEPSRSPKQRYRIAKK